MNIPMRIKRWHAGKLIILWSWGGLIAAFALIEFQSGPVSASPLLHLVCFCIAAGVLIALSVITWLWLSGKEGT
jgi:hypothetical protein